MQDSSCIMQILGEKNLFAKELKVSTYLISDESWCARTLPIIVVVAQLQHLNSPSWINICDFPSQAASQGHNLQISMLNPKWYNTLLPNFLLQNWTMNINWYLDYQMLNLESWTIIGPCIVHIANTSIKVQQ
jgi:hypothetical protein